MSSITSQSRLSCDHTYSSIANVGTVRIDDKRWITQYKGLFCVLNEVGQVLTWKLTRSLSFDHIEQQLMLLNERFHRVGKNVEEFFVDIAYGANYRYVPIIDISKPARFAYDACALRRRKR